MSPVDPVCVCAEEAAILRTRIAELERDIGWLLRFIDQLVGHGCPAIPRCHVRRWDDGRTRRRSTVDPARALNQKR